MIQTFKNCMKAGAFATASAIIGAISYSSAASAQENFPSPEAGSAALIHSAKAGRPGFVDRIFGKGGLRRSGRAIQTKTPSR